MTVLRRTATARDATKLLSRLWISAAASSSYPGSEAELPGRWEDVLAMVVAGRRVRRATSETGLGFEIRMANVSLVWSVYVAVGGVKAS